MGSLKKKKSNFYRYCDYIAVLNQFGHDSCVDKKRSEIITGFDGTTSLNNPGLWSRIFSVNRLSQPLLMKTKKKRRAFVIKVDPCLQININLALSGFKL